MAQDPKQKQDPGKELLGVIDNMMKSKQYENDENIRKFAKELKGRVSQFNVGCHFPCPPGR